MTSLNTNPHASVGVDKATTAVHKNAEKFDKNTEAYFTFLQIFSAIFDAFAHGANDVANAVGPFATIYTVYHAGKISIRRTWATTSTGSSASVALASASACSCTATRSFA